MTLKEIRDDYVRYSANVSELSRNLSYAGIGVIWIFKQTSSGGLSLFMNSIPEVLRLPLILFIVVLFLDLSQYVIQTAIWYPYYLKNKKKHANENEEDVILNEPEIYSAIPWCLWIIKLVIVVAAYVLMGVFLL